MTDDTDTDIPGTLWPPQVGEPLPRREAAFGVHDKLATYSLDLTNEVGGPKARGFERILGITLEDIHYLEAAILDAIQTAPISSVYTDSPHGVKCGVDIQVQGLREKCERVVRVRTGWIIADANTPPRLVSAYPKPS
jgi:Domain of unknown function (DUF6883)